MKKNKKEILTIIIGTIITIVMVFIVLFVVYKITNKNTPNSNYSELEKKENKEDNNSNIKDKENNDKDLSSGTGTNTPNKVTVYIFKRDTCPHCHNAINFFQSIIPNYDYLEVKTLEVTKSSNSQLLGKVADKFNVSAITSVPLIMIGKDYILNSYNNTRDVELKEAIEKAYKDINYEDLITTILNENPDLEIDAEIIAN